MPTAASYAMVGVTCEKRRLASYAIRIMPALEPEAKRWLLVEKCKKGFTVRAFWIVISSVDFIVAINRVIVSLLGDLGVEL